MNDNNNTEQFRRDNMCHHSTKTEKELYRLCPSKLTKRELEDLYFTLVENNIELKQTVNNQRETMKVLNTKLQRMTAAQKAGIGKEQKDCCANTKAVISEQKDSIAELKKANERMSERIRLLNMRLCSAKQFLKCASPYKKVSLGVTTTKISSTSALNARKTEPNVGAKTISVSCQCLEGAAAGSARSKTASTRTEPAGVEYEAPVIQQNKLCDENKCRTQMDELKQKIVNLQEELSKTHSEYSARIAHLEEDVRRLREEGVRARSERAGAVSALAERAARLRDVEAQCSDKSVQLTVERKKVSELEMRLRAARLASRVADAHAHAHENKADSLNEICPRNTTCRTDTQPGLGLLEASSAVGVAGVEAEAGAKRTGAEAEPRSGDDSGYTEQPHAAADQEKTELLMEKISELQAQLEAMKNSAGEEVAPQKKAKPQKSLELKSYDVEVPADILPVVSDAQACSLLIVDPHKKLVVEVEQPPLQQATEQPVMADKSTTVITAAEEGAGGAGAERYAALARDASRHWDDGVVLYTTRESDGTPEPIPSDKQLQSEIDETNEKYHRNMDHCDRHQPPAPPGDANSWDTREAGHKKRTIQIKQPSKSPTNRRISISTQISVNSTPTQCDMEPGGSDRRDRREPSGSDGRDRREPSVSDGRYRRDERKISSCTLERRRDTSSTSLKVHRGPTSPADLSAQVIVDGGKVDEDYRLEICEVSAAVCRCAPQSRRSGAAVRSCSGSRASRAVAAEPGLDPGAGLRRCGCRHERLLETTPPPVRRLCRVSQDSKITNGKRQSRHSNSEKSDKRPKSYATTDNKPSNHAKQQKTPEPELRLHSLEKMAQTRRPIALDKSNASIEVDEGKAEPPAPASPGSARSHRTYVLRGSAEMESPASPASPASPDTDREISSLTDLPTERDTPRAGRGCGGGALSPGEDRPATATTTSTSACSEWCSRCAPSGECDALSEGELRASTDKRLVPSPGQTHIEERWPAGTKGEDITLSTSQRMESALQAISEELERCRRLLQQTQRSSEQQRQRTVASLARAGSGASIALRGVPGRRCLGAGCRPHARFTLHVGTVVLSDEAVISSRGLRLVLAWQFYDRSAAMTRVRPARVVHFDFSTEYELDLTEEFFNYIKYEEMPLLISEPGGQEQPFASCALPLRDVLRHADTRVDMSLALVAGPRLRSARAAPDAPEEVGALDLWCQLRVHSCGPPPPPPPAADTAPPAYKNNAKPDTSTQQDFYISHVHGRNTERRSLDATTPRKDSYPFAHKLGIGVIESMQTFSAVNKVDSDLKGGVPSTCNDTPKENKYKPILTGRGVNVSEDSEDRALFQSRHTINRLRSTALPTDSYAGSTLYNYDEVMHNRIGFDENSLTLMQPNGIIMNEIPTKIKCADEMKQMCSESLEQNDMTSMKSVAVGRQFLGNEMKRGNSINNKTTDASSMHELLESENWRKMTKFSMEDGEAEVAGNREATKKVTIRSKYMYPRSPHQYVDGSSDINLLDLNKTVDITILWLALNEESDAMLDPKVQRLFVAYSFLGREGAELETPVSLPKPKQYANKCYFNFKKTFQLSESDLADLGHMGRCRAPATGAPNPKDCIVFSVVSEPPEDPLGLDNCEDIGYAYLYLGDLLAYSDGDSYTEVAAVRAARAGGAVCGVLAVRFDGLAVVRRCSVFAHAPLI